MMMITQNEITLKLSKRILIVRQAPEPLGSEKQPAITFSIFMRWAK